MRAAIYARRSKEIHQHASIEVQVGESKRYAEAKGWTVDPAHIYVDDSISRAEFKKRPALEAMQRACESKDFDVVVARDESRLGGDSLRTTLLISEILDSGVALHYYFTGEEVRLDDDDATLLMFFRNHMSERERQRLSGRTHESLLVKAREGLVVGGRCYGYDNVPVMSGSVRVKVEYAIHSEQAEVIQRIFTRYADGDGIRTIVHDLNARGVPSPRAGKRGTGSWSPSVLQAILKNERYLGRLIWNRMNEGVYKKGTKVRVPRPVGKWVVVDRPDLRIVSDELWQAAQSQFSAKQRMGRKTSTGPKGRYLLSGFARCAECGGPMQVTNSKSGKDTIKVYSCAYHRERGCCEVTTRRPVPVIDDMVIRWLEAKLLKEEVIVAALAEVRERLKKRTSEPSEVPELSKRIQKLSAEIHRLGEALLSTDQPLEQVTKMISDRESQVRDLKAKVASLEALPSVVDMETRRMEKEARARIGELKDMIRRSPVEARKVLGKLLTGPLVFSPLKTQEGPRFQVSGEAGLGSVFTIDCVPNEI
jgi:site-specific DNA recombinase